MTVFYLQKQKRSDYVELYRIDNEAVQVNVMDLFIHQKWIDDRLVFPKNMTKDKFISLQSVWKQRIWTPDTFFKNGIAGDLTSENFRTNYFQLYENKTVWMSSRVSVDLVCEMDFSKYPHDFHFCNISLMSLSHRKITLNLNWEVFQLSKRLFNTDFEIKFVRRWRCDKTYDIGE
ncbi:Glycine receptor subunit alpha-2-like protein [Dinothrombium tinctorium]|uniref:Glycine receptor subunit alpha-2-like protein n=1 Tax=Dinothrombium tinctorium TaxID=1965070 RepID=A0A3S3NP21_9ACAR|nr:Glycine receptor subunit alpha-2-like protein [Dinothrombium tinctorium]